MQNSVNHRDFERKWRFQLPAGSTLPPVAPPPPSGAPRARSERGRCSDEAYTHVSSGRRLKWRPPASRPRVGARDLARLLVRCLSRRADVLTKQSVSLSRRYQLRARTGLGPCGACVCAVATRLSSRRTHARNRFFSIPPWSDVRPPAELKHITKRRRRKQP